MPKMGIPPGHHRIIPLQCLSYYPKSDWLDKTLYLPWTENTRRRVWLMIPHSSPTISVDDVTLEPQCTVDQRPRWIDYGAQQLPIRPQHWYGGEFHQLWIGGSEVSECAGSCLVIASQLGAFQNWGEFQKAVISAEVARETSILSTSKDAVLDRKPAVFESRHAERVEA